MKILVTGSLGYIGLPLVRELKNNIKHEVIGVDNNSRPDWVDKVGGKDTFRLCDSNAIYGDLINRDFVKEILSIHKPDVIIHLASQPSMPYSQINGERALFTQTNNLSMCVNLLWGIKECGLDSRFIITTTTGIPGQHYKSIPEEPVLNRAGSWYHVTRGFDSANCSLAARQWGLNCIEFRTSIVYGSMHSNRFDTDPYFGTVLNRFVNQGINKKPITIYGEGLQTKPFISIGDTVESLINAITYKFPKGHTILNQVTEMLSVEKLANLVADATNSRVKHIKNPRKENETFCMRFENEKFLKVLKRKPEKAKKVIKDMVSQLTDRDTTYTVTGNTDDWAHTINKGYFGGTSN